MLFNYSKNILRTSVFITAILSAVTVYAAKLDDYTLQRKAENYYITGLPLINYTSDNGLGYGARVYLYDNGERSDRYFDSSPYNMQFYAQCFFTTKGMEYHELNLDMPYIFATKFRVITAIVYDKALNANYFGTGAGNARSGLTDIFGNSYSTWNDYYDRFLASYGKQYLKWNSYTLFKPTWYLYLYYDINDYFKLMCGAEFKKVEVDTWDGRRADGAVQTLTKLQQDYNNGRVNGLDGGWSNLTRFGIAFDTRDFEPDPHSGLLAEYSIEGSGSGTGSEYGFIKNTAALTGYIPLGSIVVAARGGYTSASSGIPFYEMCWFGFVFDRREGLGGNRTLRGYKQDRFVARTMTAGNVELRWQFYEVYGLGQRFAFKLIGFVDTGNAYDNWTDPVTSLRFGDYHNAYGGGVVISWNLSTVIHFYYGRSSEDSSVSIHFKHAF